MRINYYSDLHLEFLNYDQVNELARLIVKHADGDVLVLAGDICIMTEVDKYDLLLSYMHGYEGVVMIAGNHEGYDSSIYESNLALLALSKRHPNTHYLEKSSVSIGGLLIAGTTLWYSYCPIAAMHCYRLADFRAIAEGKEYGLNYFTDLGQEASDYLSKVKAHLWVTHHGVNEGCISDFYKKKGVDTNGFYYRDMSNVAIDHYPSNIIHGHIHSSEKYRLGPSRVSTNPYGYGGENYDFEWDKHIDIN